MSASGIVRVVAEVARVEVVVGLAVDDGVLELVVVFGVVVEDIPIESSSIVPCILVIGVLM